VIYDDRPASRSFGSVEEIQTGENDYRLVQIPPLVWYGFKSVGKGPALIANCTDIPHNPAEVIQLPVDSGQIPYRWQ